MSDTINELLSFFGLLEAPENLSELFPWLGGFLLAIGFLLGILSIFRVLFGLGGRLK